MTRNPTMKFRDIPRSAAAELSVSTPNAITGMQSLKHPLVATGAAK